jgi:hypothetical protein
LNSYIVFDDCYNLTLEGLPASDASRSGERATFFHVNANGRSSANRRTSKRQNKSCKVKGFLFVLTLEGLPASDASRSGERATFFHVNANGRSSANRRTSKRQIDIGLAFSLVFTKTLSFSSTLVENGEQ